MSFEDIWLPEPIDAPQQIIWENILKLKLEKRAKSAANRFRKKDIALTVRQNVEISETKKNTSRKEQSGNGKDTTETPADIPQIK